jgi:FAD/FMN-containing dehydrogenase
MTGIAQRRSLDPATIGRLLPAFRGQVAVSADPVYEEARKVWNGSIDRRPAAILRCAGVPDVVAGLRLAKALGGPLAVRGGGTASPASGPATTASSSTWHR